MSNPVETRLEDPLSETARRERRALLGFAALAIFLVWTGGFPAKINIFGAELAESPDQIAVGLGAVIFYFLLFFSVYATIDLLRWRPKLIEAEDRILRLDTEIAETVIDKESLREKIDFLKAGIKEQTEQDAKGGGFQPVMRRSELTGELRRSHEADRGDPHSRPLDLGDLRRMLTKALELDNEADEKISVLRAQKTATQRLAATRSVPLLRRLLDIYFPILLGVLGLASLGLVLAGVVPPAQPSAVPGSSTTTTTSIPQVPSTTTAPP